MTIFLPCCRNGNIFFSGGFRVVVFTVVCLFELFFFERKDSTRFLGENCMVSYEQFLKRYFLFSIAQRKLIPWATSMWKCSSFLLVCRMSFAINTDIQLLLDNKFNLSISEKSRGVLAWVSRRLLIFRVRDGCRRLSLANKVTFISFFLISTCHLWSLLHM